MSIILTALPKDLNINTIFKFFKFINNLLLNYSLLSNLDIDR